MEPDRLADLETRIAYQEDQIDTLNTTVYQQQQQIERLEAWCQMLARQWRTLSDTAPETGSADERPPHY